MNEKFSLKDLIIFHTLNNGRFQGKIAFENGVCGVLLLLLMVKKNTKGKSLFFNTIITEYIQESIEKILKTDSLSILNLSEFYWSIYSLRKDSYFSTRLSDLDKELAELIIDKIRLADYVDNTLPRVILLLSQASSEIDRQIIFKVLKKHIEFYLNKDRLKTSASLNDLQFLYCLKKQKQFHSYEKKVDRMLSITLEKYDWEYLNDRLPTNPIRFLYITLYISKLSFLTGATENLQKISTWLFKQLPELNVRYSRVSPDAIECFDLLQRLSHVLHLKKTRFQLADTLSKNPPDLTELSLSNIRGMGALYKNISNSNLIIYPI